MLSKSSIFWTHGSLITQKWTLMDFVHLPQKQHAMPNFSSLASPWQDGSVEILPFSNGPSIYNLWTMWTKPIQKVSYTIINAKCTNVLCLPLVAFKDAIIWFCGPEIDYFQKLSRVWNKMVLLRYTSHEVPLGTEGKTEGRASFSQSRSVCDTRVNSQLPQPTKLDLADLIVLRNNGQVT